MVHPQRQLRLRLAGQNRRNRCAGEAPECHPRCQRVAGSSRQAGSGPSSAHRVSIATKFAGLAGSSRGFFHVTWLEAAAGSSI
jgi:hypothetical protein